MSSKILLSALFLVVPWAGSAAFCQAIENPVDPSATAPMEAAPTEPVPAPQPLASTSDSTSDLDLGISQFVKGNYEEALEALKKARERNPRSARAAYYLGATLKAMQLHGDAIQHLKDATMLQPAEPKAFLLLADVLYAQGRLDEAAHALEVSAAQGIEPAQTEFLRGLIMAKKREYDEAIRSFTKAKSLAPSMADGADFQIATALARKGKMEEALALFRAVSARSPGSDTGMMAQQQAEALAKRMETMKPFQAVVSLQYQYDSNVLLKPDASSAAVNISGEADSAVVLNARAEYTPRLADPYALRMQYALYVSQYFDLSEFNVQSHTLAITPGFRVGGESAVNIMAGYTYTLVDNEKYLSVASLSPVYSMKLTEKQALHLLLRYQMKDFLTPPSGPDENRDATELAAGATWALMIAPPRGSLNLKYEWNQEDADGKHWSYQGHRIAATFSHPLGRRSAVRLGVDVFAQQFDNIREGTDIKREDTTYTATAQGMYELNEWLGVQADYSYIKDDSNVDVYAFTKHVVSLGLSARF